MWCDLVGRCDCKVSKHGIQCEEYESEKGIGFPDQLPGYSPKKEDRCQPEKDKRQSGTPLVNSEECIASSDKPYMHERVLDKIILTVISVIIKIPARDLQWSYFSKLNNISPFHSENGKVAFSVMGEGFREIYEEEGGHRDEDDEKYFHEFVS